jgi:hypothetical protein
MFRLALVPVKPGTFKLPMVKWVYFDIAQKAYRTLNTPLPELHVQPGEPDPSKQLLVQTQPADPQKQSVEFTGRDIFPLKEGLDALTAHRPLSGFGLAVWMLTPAALFAGLLGIHRARRTELSPAARMKIKARKALASAQASNQDPADFLTHLYQALTAAVFAAAGRSGEALTWKEVETMLTQQGLDPAVAHQAAETLCAIESAKFSGTHLEPQQGQLLLEKTQTLIRRLAP